MHDLDPEKLLRFHDNLQVFHSPQLESEAIKIKEELPPHISDRHFALFSSGTMGGALKGYALSEKAMEANARAVNEFYQLTAKDIWGLSIPLYHVGGLSVLMRARLSGSRVIDCRGWNPQIWIEKVAETKVTVTTIVPTQLYDLVKENFKAPPSLRLLIVGGDFLSTELQKRALNLGWSVLRTYGMSEVCSQLASERTPQEGLEVLPLHQVKANDGGRLLVKTPSLFTIQFLMKEKLEITKASAVCDADDFYPTQDRVKLSGAFLEPLGRMDEQLKAGGHLVDLPTLKEAFYNHLLQQNLYGRAEVTIEDDSRKGKKLVLIHNQLDKDELQKISQVMLPQKIDELRCVEYLTRTDLGKLKK